MENMKKDYPENAETIAQAQAALKECFEAAQEGKVINLDQLAKGGNQVARQASAMVVGAEDLIKKAEALPAAVSRAQVWDPDKVREISPLAQRAYAASVKAGGSMPPTGGFTNPLKSREGQDALFKELKSAGLEPKDAVTAYFKLKKTAELGHEYMEKSTPRIMQLLKIEHYGNIPGDPRGYGADIPDWKHDMEYYNPGGEGYLSKAEHAAQLKAGMKESKG